MNLTQYTVVLLQLNPNAPELDDAASAVLQDAHMSYLADLYDQGVIAAVGPLLDERMRGLTILNVAPDRAVEIMAADPAVRAGRFSTVVTPWLVPEGTIAFPHGRLPRSMADVG